MSVQYIGSLTIADVFPAVGDLVTSLDAAIAAFVPLNDLVLEIQATLNAVLDLLVTIEGGLDFAINFEFGLGALKFLAMLDFQAALNVSLSLGLAISNPLANISLSISALMQALASLQASLALGLPTVSFELGLQLDAVLAVSLAASAKMAGIQIAIDALLSLLGPIVAIKATIQGLLDLILSVFMDFVNLFNIVISLTAQFALHMPSGGVYLYSGNTLYSSYEPILGAPPSGLTASTEVQSIVMLVDPISTPDTWASLQFMVKTTP
jgi:hypothetical protein